MSQRRFQRFADFYPFYLSQHRTPGCRRWHYLGSTLVLVALFLSLLVSRWWLIAMPLAGYGCAWFGHWQHEHNRPATFSHPVYSLLGDWVMFGQWLSRRLPPAATWPQPDP